MASDKGNPVSVGWSVVGVASIGKTAGLRQATK